MDDLINAIRRKCNRPLDTDAELDDVPSEELAQARSMPRRIEEPTGFMADEDYFIHDEN